VPRVIIAADAQTVINDVRAVLDDGETEIVEVSNGADVRTEVEEEETDLVIADFQVGNMGAMAICLDLRLEESGGRLPYVPVLMLCDRRADVFLAKRSQADGYLVKPLDPIRLRKAIAALLDEGTYFDDSYRPVPTLVSAPAGPAHRLAVPTAAAVASPSGS
jgi:DNA-binding response OmpR family regulator